MPETSLAQKIVQEGILTTAELSEAEKGAFGQGLSLAEYLLQSKQVPKNERTYELLAEVFEVPYVDLSNFQVSTEAIQYIPADLARRYKVIPLFKLAENLNVVMENPAELAAIDHLIKKTHCQIDVCLGAGEAIEHALNQYYGSANAVSNLLETLGRERSRLSISAKPGAAHSLEPQQGDHPIVSLVNLMLRQGIEEGASDIHVEPNQDNLMIRYRVDGVLHEASRPPKQFESEVISRIKVLSGMDIAESRMPQDGRIKMNFNGKDVEMRVSAVPTIHGENIVIRILKDPGHILDLKNLGFSEEMRHTFESLIQSSYGMILETGPTGSGKTTTLYAALSKINSVERNIITVEDPVEYKLPMIRQIQINPKANLTFANALRSILRQDPDIIMIGEIRDKETAEIAVHSAMTGHLVFSTLHTNTACGAITRLADMGIEPFLISSSVMAVMSQRLVRRLCDSCKEETAPSDVLLKALKVPAGEIKKVFKPKGCRVCRNMGYKGRSAIYELLKITEPIQRKITHGCDIVEIEAEARRAGFKSLREDGLEKVKAGVTTLEEVIKAVNVG